MKKPKYMTLAELVQRLKELTDEVEDISKDMSGVWSEMSKRVGALNPRAEKLSG